MANDDRKTLVLGGGGFLGAHVVASAVAHGRANATFAAPHGDPVVATSRAPELAPRFCNPRDAAEWEAVELAPPGSARELLERVRPTHVIQCAALARVGDCEAQPELAARLNTELAQEVARWCDEHAVRLVHVSTDLVFGRDDAPEGGFDEAAAVAPVNHYGVTKAEGEAAVLAACPGAAVARLPLLYGNSGGRGLGASDSLLEAVERDERPPLFDDEWRTPLEVSNAAEALVELAETDFAGILHIAGPRRTSRYELGLAALVAMGLEPAKAVELVERTSSDDVATQGERPRDVSLDSRTATRLLETRLLDVDDGMRRAMS